MRLLGILAVMLTAPGYALAADRPGPIVSADENVLAAECLRHSVTELIASPEDIPSRAGRMIVLSKFAERLDPHNPQIARLLANIYQIRGMSESALGALAKYLAALPDDLAMSGRWIDLKLATLDTADERIALLASVAGDENRPASLRSQAAGQWAGILARQGRKNSSMDVFVRALELDPSSVAGLRGLLAMQETPSPEVVADTLLWRLRGSPRSFELAWQLAGLLGAQSLYDESLYIFDHARAVVSAGGVTAGLPAEFQTQYCSAMLDAGRYKRAAETFEPMLSATPYNGDLHSLMVEAYKALGEQDKAQQTIRTMAANYRAMEAGATWKQSGPVCAEIAWFYLVTMPDAARALTYARKARLREADPVVERILGAAEIAVGSKTEGAARLVKLAERDTYAAALLAEHYFAEGDLKSGKLALDAGASLGRSGPAFRKLLAVAVSQGLTIPPSEASKRIRQLFDAFDKSFMQVALTPEGFVSVQIRPLAQRLRPGDSVEVEAVLANTDRARIPLGASGLFSPEMSFRVSANVPEGAVFEALPMAVWPAPGYLRAGQTVNCTVRLDVADLAALLRARPFDELTLTVTGMLDPVQRGRTFVSALPQVRPEPASIVRLSLLGHTEGSPQADLPKAYQLAIGRIVRDLRRGDLVKRIVAVKQIASLLCFVDRLRSGEAELAPELRGEVKKPVLLSLLRAAIQDKSPVIRAQMLAELASVPVGPDVFRLLGEVISDPSPLVRFRDAELIGLSGSARSKVVLAHLAGDEDPLVRTMARIFLGRPAEAAPSR